MGTPDDPSSLTPTELYAMENEGAQPGGDTAYQRFRDLVHNAGSTGMDAVKQFEAWKARNPIAQWAVDAAPMANPMFAGAGAIRGVIAAGQAAASPSKPLNEPVAPDELKTREPTSFQRDIPTTPVSALPDYKQNYAMSAGMGTDATSGYGTDKAVLGSQLDYLGDMGGLQEKRGEEATAHLKSLATAADLKEEYANQQKLAANAFQKAAQDSEDEQRAMQTNMQQATDDVASRGVDPGRYFKNRDVGWWAGMMIGSIASGVLSAMSGRGGENPFMDSVRAMVHDDIASQEKAIDQGWKKVKGMETAYERMRQLGVDKVTATGKQYDLTLQAFQTEIQARLQRAQLPEEKARLEGALQEIQIERDKEGTKLQEYWQAVHQKRASAAAAAVMAQRSAERQARMDAAELDLKKAQTYKTAAEGDKLRAEAGTNGLSKDDAERVRALQAGYNAVDQAKTAFQTNTKGSITGTTPISQIPGTDAMKFRQDVESWNTRATLLLGPVVEAMNKGKPGAVEMHDLQKRVLIEPGMSQQEIQTRMQNLQKLQQDAAATMNQTLQQPAAFGQGASTFAPKGR